MSGFSHGMNTDLVREQAIRIDGVVGDLDAVSAGIEQTVARLAQQWRGPDMERFQGWWRDQHKPNLARISESIAGLAQSARNNAEEQDRASDNSGGSAGGAGVIGGSVGPVSPSPGAVSPPAAGGDVMPSTSWQSAQARYDAWATGRFAAGGESHYQCTGWANFRWQELGYGSDISGDGWQMAGNAGATTPDPSLHAMASYGSGVNGDYGHVMIVEEMSADGSQIRVSEMNVGDKNYEVGLASEYRDDDWITRGADGVFRSSGGSPIDFAAFPG